MEWSGAALLFWVSAPSLTHSLTSSLRLEFVVLLHRGPRCRIGWLRQLASLAVGCGMLLLLFCHNVPQSSIGDARNIIVW